MLKQLGDEEFFKDKKPLKEKLSKFILPKN